MTKDNVRQLSLLVREKRSELLERWRAEVRTLPGARGLDRPTLDNSLPQLLDELADALEAHCDATITEAHLVAGAREHGVQRLHVGFDLGEVVAEYNVLRGCLHDFANAHGLVLLGEAFHIVNRVLDEAIAEAVRAYADERERETQERRDEHVAFVAHDLRTPLQAMSLGAAIVEDGLRRGDPAESLEALETLQRNLRRLHELVTEVASEAQLLDEDGERKLFRRELDLWPLVERLARDLQPLYERSGTRLENRVPRDLSVRADAELLGRVFQNLLANAIEYAPGGRVTVAAARRDGKVEVVVADDGRGIPPELLTRVFEKLEADPEKEPGRGLGLAIVHDLVELHGGRISVDSQLGQGTAFRFELPA